MLGQCNFFILSLRNVVSDTRSLRALYPLYLSSLCLFISWTWGEQKT
ncbi:hypothetical protein LOK49_LG05G01000 [Camellia lanceoleosa]|uniref:Uncharacterized protein n=1 Tax=Camellia lanceoleosa TaxID=1840588 RepID=A0ACC0HUQ0_9ERIC|nr:hypothetical protein LOK49_LG05G01000 [Camellia lanceoleosa]